MSLELLHRQCSREVNGVGPLLSPETTSEISNGEEEEEPRKKMSNQTCHPTTLPTRVGSVAGGAPPWLLSTLAGLNEKMGWMAVGDPERDDTGETFAQRAESYYQKRPQLIAFLQDLYRAYISLSERYVQLLSKNSRASHHSRHSSHVSALAAEECCYSENDLSDTESALSFQQPLHSSDSVVGTQRDFDALVAEIVMKNVECDILHDEVEIGGRRSNDASRKIELQRSLLEVLESERLILLNENARLGYRVGALVEENRELARESAFVKRKAAELARCLLKMREDQAVCGLSRKIEDLQGQIYGLEKRNREYYEQLVRKEVEAGDGKKGSSREVGVEVRFKMEKFKRKPVVRSHRREKRSYRWWERVKRMDIFMCGLMQADDPDC